MCFSVNNAKFLRTPILKNFCERLLLYKTIYLQQKNSIQILHLSRRETSSLIKFKFESKYLILGHFYIKETRWLILKKIADFLNPRASNL